MENLREVVAKNLSTLRKQNNLTQIELAQKINFSDKAISRWENGEVLPDVETLQKLSEVFNVPISTLLDNQANLQKTKSTRLTKKDVLSQIFLFCEIWTVISVVYAYLNISLGLNLWQVFLWGVPATFLLLIIQNRKKKNNIVSFVYWTIFVWTFITCLFLVMLKSCPWYFFILGVPTQGILIVRFLFNYKQPKLIDRKNK